MEAFFQKIEYIEEIPIEVRLVQDDWLGASQLLNLLMDFILPCVARFAQIICQKDGHQDFGALLLIQSYVISDSFIYNITFFVVAFNRRFFQRFLALRIKRVE